LDDEQDFPVPESMDHLIGPSDVSKDGQPIGLIVKQNRIVRSDLLTIVIAHQDRPRILSDQPTNYVGVLTRVERIVSHEVPLFHDGRNAGMGGLRP
jgi:hypothetical protein